MKHRPTEKDQLAKAAAWNKTTPAGTTIRYRPIRGEGEGVMLETDSEAYMLSGHTAVVKLKGKSGCFALDNCEAL